MIRGRALRAKDPPGQRLRALREALGISGRDVQTYSRLIAHSQGSKRHYISHSSLVDIERSTRVPSVHKLFTLSALYRINFVDLLLFFGIDLDQINTARLAIKLPKTHLVPSEIYDTERRVSFPVKFDPGARIEDTNLLSRMVQTWGEIPIAGIQSLALRKYQYGFIGMDDYTLYPMIRPGAFVQIDDEDTEIDADPGENEFERPIYFFQWRDGYACGWCRLDGKVLSIIPHGLSRVQSRQFIYPDDIDVVGRVVAVAMQLRRKPGGSSLAGSGSKRNQ
jgi:transcriptional regulator with XRE-family HTH domain